MNAVLAERQIRGRSDAGDLRMAEEPCVAALFIEPAEEAVHAVLAGEYHPVIGRQLFDARIHALEMIGRLCNGDHGDLDAFRAERCQMLRQAGGLAAGPGDHHPLPEQRLVVEPAHVFPGRTTSPTTKTAGGWMCFFSTSSAARLSVVSKTS